LSVSRRRAVTSPRSRRSAVRLGIAGLLWVAGCKFGQGRPVLEQVSPTIPGGKFQVIATVAGGSGPADLRMSVTVRQLLNDSGWTAVRRAGRWDNQGEAVVAICSGTDVQGVLFVWYNRLELDDCETKKPAYAIDGSPERGVGLTEMGNRLIRYLRRQPPAPSP
jgi:hypothetical protein